MPPSERRRFGGLVGLSLAMRELFAVLELCSPTEVTVLIEGGSGTGKELAARAIHDHSERAAGPFVVVDCSALSESLIESHLFGHAKGAFTGAAEGRRGAFVEASGGTLFLDEIGELPLEMQPNLLRVLETRQVRRVGGVADRTVDVVFDRSDRCATPVTIRNMAAVVEGTVDVASRQEWALGYTLLP